jgi:hypothetical protein
MKTTYLSAASFAVLLAAASLSPAFAADKPKLTSAVQNALAEAQKAQQKNDIPGAEAAIAKAQAVDGRKPYDDLMINVIKTQVEIQAGNLPAADAAAEAAADSTEIPDDSKQAIYDNGLMLALNAQHTDKALAYAKQIDTLGGADPRIQSYVAKAYFLANDYAGTIAASQKALAAAKAANTKLPHDAYLVLAAAQVANKDQAGARATLEGAVQEFNDPQDWTQLIDVALGTQGLRDLDVIYLGRLLVATNAAISTSQAAIIGETASRLTFYGDAEAMKEHGGTGFADPTAAAAKDKAAIPGLLATAAKDKNGGLLYAKVAQAQYSYGLYPDAEASARQSIAKGGDPDASEPQMVLAMSLAGQGKYQDAIAAFKAVTGGGPATARAAELWVIYCNVKLTPPATATAAAAPAK